jgi:glucose-6-phosphate 1-dehydrogenase
MKVSPSVMVIFGGTGNLTTTKLIPALYQLEVSNLLPDNFKVVSVARKKLTSEEYRKSLLESLTKHSRSVIDEPTWKKFSEKIDFLCADFNDEVALKDLSGILDELEEEWQICFNRIFYLAVAPSFFPVVFDRLKKYRLNEGCAKDSNPARIIIEKPFGKDLKTAQELNTKLSAIFKEEQIYRIDHYLGKETVQNILTFRFGNEIFEPILNNKFVDHIQIIMAEELGVEGRGEFYEEAGALRDVVQNHLLQVLALITMDEPKEFSAESIRREKYEILKSIRFIEPREVDKLTIRGQYGPGKIDGEKVPSYRQENEVDKDSPTETFVALKTFIDNDCWKGVPIYIKTGKRLNKKVTSMTIQFKEAGHRLFEKFANKPEANLLTFQLQPDEGVAVRFVAKKPGFVKDLQDVDMEFCYNSAFQEQLPEAYERLLIDVMNGDQTLFPHINEVEESWRFVDKILDGWKKSSPPKFPNYEAGTWGPKESDELVERDGRSWLAHQLSVCQIHFRN